MPTERSERPVPRLSNRIRRENDESRSFMCREARVLPVELEMRQESVKEHEVEWAVAGDLVSDVDVAAPRVVGRHSFHAGTIARREAPASLLVVLVLAGCGGGDDGATTETAAAPPPTGGCSDAKSSADDRTLSNEHKKLEADKTYRLVFETNCGNFTVTLDQKRAPNATGSLVSLAERSFFDGTVLPPDRSGLRDSRRRPDRRPVRRARLLDHDPMPSIAKYSHGVVAMAKSAAEPAGRRAASSSS